MSFLGDLPSSGKPPGGADPSVPLLNLSTVQTRMDTLQKFLSDSVNRNTLISKDHMDMVSSEIASAIQQIIVNGAALLACTQDSTNLPRSARTVSENKVVDFQSTPVVSASSEEKLVDPRVELIHDEDGDDYEIVELDAVELLAENIHFCEICGKGFKRDANLRMHMRAHGNQFKTPEALAKPERDVESIGGPRKTKFSCPYVGCNKNKQHKKFKPLKSVICVKNHFKRSHCPRMFSCNRCNKKSFSVVADLKSHLKHCGEVKWKCSCGTTFSRKDKLFGHMALFEGHMPAVMEEEGEKGKRVAAMVEDDEHETLKPAVKGMEMGRRAEMGLNEKGSLDHEFFDELLDGFDSIENYFFQDLLDSPNAANTNGFGTGIEGFFDI